ncbi:MAG: hypothetical protein ACRCTU_03955 [Zoogloea sp.]|uniref:hypothetical protein n=1 Tax=Zoogloea sp. TaxID=49181 RepID=UPI003F32A504
MVDFDRYVFVVVQTEDDYSLLIRRISLIVCASNVLCFLIDWRSRSVLDRVPEVGALFDFARNGAPAVEHSFVCSIDRDEIFQECPRGVWRELFLGLEPDEKARERKVRDALREVISPKNGVVVSQLLDVSKVVLPLLKLFFHRPDV